MRRKGIVIQGLSVGATLICYLLYGGIATGEEQSKLEISTPKNLRVISVSIDGKVLFSEERMQGLFESDSKKQASVKQDMRGIERTRQEAKAGESISASKGTEHAQLNGEEGVDAKAMMRGIPRPDAPRIDYVVMSEIGKPETETPTVWSRMKSKVLPSRKQGDIIWYDDFNGIEKRYAEKKGELVEDESFGGSGRSLLCLYEKGKKGGGNANRKVFFGDTPTYQGNAVRVDEKFDELYWRIYVKHQYGWKGSPDKMSRAISLHDSKWSEAMASHVYSMGEPLTLDPVSGVNGSKVVTKGYNDFENFKWMGNRPTSRFKIHSTEEAGWWVCVEARVKLNTPGKKDGINQLWIDGRLEAERRNLDWRGSYTEHTINAVFLEAYWNKGSPVTQKRWYDNFVISTKPIGPVVCPRNPELTKTPYSGPGEQAGWEVELTDNPDRGTHVWKSKLLESERSIRIDTQQGKFAGVLSNRTLLAPDTMYFSRVRQKSTGGGWSNWSRWHQPFLTEPEM